jgi:hypothetical protein
MRRLISSLTGLVLAALAATACTTPVGSAASPDEANRIKGRPAGLPPTTVAAPPQGPTVRQRPVTVYYPRNLGEQWYLVPERHQVAVAGSQVEAAVTELLGARPRYDGSTPPFPRGSRLLGLSEAGGTVTVDLSREVTGVARGEPSEYAVQALVWTVTRAGDARRVLVEVEGRSAGVVDGRPLSDLWGGRGSAAGLVRDRGVRLAPVALTEPLPGARVEGDRIVVKGEASVLDGIVSLRLVDTAGAVAAQGFTSAEGAAPRRAPFSASLAFDPPATTEQWTLQVFEASPDDGTVRYSVLVPVRVGG